MAIYKTTMPVQPDHEGNLTQEIRVSLDTPSPSSNAVRVEFEADDGEVVTTAVVHEVPDPEIGISPLAGPPGASVLLTGEGFRYFAPITSVSVGGIDVLGCRRLSTDASGRFYLEFIVPGTGSWPQPVRIDVSGALARTYFQVSPGGVLPGNAAPVDQALASLGHRLDVVFHFDNLSKSWSFYDPDLDEENSLDFLTDGALYFIAVNETVQTVLNGKTRTPTCGDGNCWNVIVW